MKNIFIAIVVALCCTIMAPAQSIKGSVKNTQEQPLSYSNIKVLNTNYGTSTDVNGTFELNLPQGSYEIQISQLGYATVVKSISITNKTKILNITLTPTATRINELVVTAQKREEPSLKVPVAITTLDSKRLVETRTWNLEDLTSLIPNYSYSKLGVGFQELQSIRGIQVFSENPAIATYIDGVNSLDISAGGLQFMDVERVEVLRGPQGTLYGRNALGGVVNIITKQPTNETKGFYEASIGNLGLQRHGVSYKTPLKKDHLFFGISSQYQYRNGFLTNSTEGTADPQPGRSNRRVGDESSLYANAFLKYIPNDRWKYTLNIKTQIDQSNASAFFVSVADDQTAIANPNTINLGRVGSHQRNLLNISNATSYNGANVTLSSISAYQRTAIQFDDIDFFPAAPGQLFTSYNNGQTGVMNKPQEVFTQEFKIQSTPKGDRLNYTAGAFYFNQTNYEPSTNTARMVNDTELDVFSQIGKNEGIAAYGQLDYAFAKAFTLTAGLRYEYENRKLIFSRFTDNMGAITINTPRTEVSGDYQAVLPKFALAYELGNNHKLYASYTRGFRAGGINGDLLPEGVPQTYDPEFSDNYEIGYKSIWLNHRLSVNLTAFHINWQCLQFFNSFGNFVFARSNVGDATSRGIELEVISKPIKNLQLEGSLGWNDTAYDNFVLSRDIFDPSTNTIITTQTDVSNNQLSNAPTHTLFLAGQYLVQLPKNRDLNLRLEYRGVGRQFTDIQNDLEIAPYELFNSMISYSRGSTTLSVWVRNIGNERFINFGSADTSFGRSTRMAEPRTFGGTLNLKF